MEQVEYPPELLEALEKSVRVRGIQGTIKRLRTQGRPSIVESALKMLAFKEKTYSDLGATAMFLAAKNASITTIYRVIKQANLSEEEAKYLLKTIEEIKKKGKIKALDHGNE